MIYAEVKREQSDDGYYTLRYFVYNGDIIGTYGVMFRPNDEPYGASRDFHKLATLKQIEARRAYDEFEKLPKRVQNARRKAGTDPDYVLTVYPCMYHDDRLCICDGSSLVEVTTNEQRAFEIAALMAGVTR